MATEIELSPGIITPPIHRFICNLMTKIMRRKDVSVLNAIKYENNLNSISIKLNEQKYNTVSDWEKDIRGYLDECIKSENKCTSLVAEDINIYLNKKIPFISQCSEFHFRTLTNQHINELFEVLHITEEEYNEFAQKYRVIKNIIDCKIKNAKNGINKNDEEEIPILTMAECRHSNKYIVVDDYGLKKTKITDSK